MRHIYLFITFVCFHSTLFAQSSNIIRCSTTEHHHQLMEDPIKRAIHESRVANVYRTEVLSNTDSEQGGGCPNMITIPVAVHYQDVSIADQACLEELAYSQIAVLNQDYRAENADVNLWASVAAAFPGVQPGVACIEFCLATQSHPAGYNLTNDAPAITYNQTNGDFEADWAGYINIFVQNLGGGILGYSPLGGQGDGDGVVIDHCAFGVTGLNCSIGPNANTCGSDWAYTLGRTLTHELGHYFLLEHTFENCSPGDGIADTPPSNTPYYGCPSLGPSTTACNNTQAMFMNYMDYVDDPCMYMFTPMQMNVVEQYANNNLSNLVENGFTVCGTAIVVAPTANFNYSATTLCPNSPTITFSNASTGGMLSYAWTFSGAGVSPTTATTAGSTVTISQSGTLTATLTVTNTEGTDTHTEQIAVTLLSADAPQCQTNPCAEAPESLYEITATPPNAGTTDILGSPAGIISCNSYEPGTSWSSSYFINNGGQFDWQVWAGEGYQFNLEAGTTYSFSICGDGGNAWDPHLTAEAPSGNIDADADDCGVTFTATESGIYTIYFSEAGNCGTVIQSDNGHLVVTLVSCETLNHCENGVQDEDETGIDCGGADCATCPCLVEITADVQMLCGSGFATYTVAAMGGSGSYLISVNGMEYTTNPATFTLNDQTAYAIIVADANPNSTCGAAIIEGAVDCPVICEQAISATASVACASGSGYFSLTVSGGEGAYTLSGDALVQTGAGMYGNTFANGETVSISIDDENTACEPITISETINCPLSPAPPTAQDAAYNLSANTVLHFDLSSLSSDINESDVLTYTIEQPIEGTIDIDPLTGDASFTPNLGFEGTVSVAYSVSDGVFEPTTATIVFNVVFDCGSVPPLASDYSIELLADNTFFIVHITPTGGLPAYDSGMTSYTIVSPDFNLTALPGEVITQGPFDATGVASYTIMISDELGCELVLIEGVSTTLGVNLVRFSGILQADDNILQWTTASEWNNDFFTLSRSLDGIHFTDIATVKGNGTTQLPQSYTYTDINAPKSAVVYYRLQQTDFDGTSDKLHTISLNRQTTGLQWSSVQPIPTRDVVNIGFVLPENILTQIRVFDVAGRLLQTQVLPATKGNNNVLISLADYTSGIYMVSVSNAAGMLMTKVVKE